ncbi:hypothetical protein GO730_12635 [Spirosoma sp. HMF3257]|uniref:Uncharacterized protein n=1 Tax=Spirosoma telluris TaxID=2183553 RepID=A0A327NQA4_9BACT|nr:hypothetical protein [Spirosoma telluris]RAI74858.1 hypothetical protein HMF3257_12545 [Spirosoma telluris]
MHINSFLLSVTISFSLIASSCQQDLNPVISPNILYQSNFQQNQDGWQADIADYSTQQQDMRFESGWAALPSPLDTTRKSVRVSSMNRSDDLFMFLKKKLTGLQANTDYTLVFDIELASAYGTNSIGIGGSPGGSVFLKAGATATEPAKVLGDDFYTINLDKGNQATGGKDAVLLGNIGAGDDVTAYKLITRSNANNPLTVRTNAQGELWLVIGTDSGYEGLTTLYYSAIRVTAK